MIWRSLLLLVCWVATGVVFAASGGHGADHDPHAIPWQTIGVQTFNFLAIMTLLVVTLRKKVKEHFQIRRSTFTELMQKAERAQAEAERSRREISERLRQLEASATNSVEQARGDAEELKQKILHEAKTLSERLTAEAQRTAQFEVERAKLELRTELLNSSIEAAQKSLRESVNGADQKKLQNDFVEKIQVVR